MIMQSGDLVVGQIPEAQTVRSSVEFLRNSCELLVRWHPFPELPKL